MYIFFGSQCIYFYGMYMLWGDTTFYVFLFLLLFLVSHVIHWLLIYIMRLSMIYVFYFLFCEIKNLFIFTCIFHTCVYVFVKCFRNIQVYSVVLLSTLATNR